VENALIVIGMSSVVLLWVFSIAGALATVLATVRDTVDDHLEGLIKHIRWPKG